MTEFNTGDIAGVKLHRAEWQEGGDIFVYPTGDALKTESHAQFIDTRDLDLILFDYQTATIAESITASNLPPEEVSISLPNPQEYIRANAYKGFHIEFPNHRTKYEEDNVAGAGIYRGVLRNNGKVIVVDAIDSTPEVPDDFDFINLRDLGKILFNYQTVIIEETAKANNVLPEEVDITFPNVKDYIETATHREG